jgi:hypothetical protein
MLPSRLATASDVHAVAAKAHFVGEWPWKQLAVYTQKGKSRTSALCEVLTSQLECPL